MRLRRDGECSRCSAAPARQTALPHSFVRLEFSLLHFNHPLSFLGVPGSLEQRNACWSGPSNARIILERGNQAGASWFIRYSAGKGNAAFRVIGRSRFVCGSVGRKRLILQHLRLVKNKEQTRWPGAERLFVGGEKSSRIWVRTMEADLVHLHVRPKDRLFHSRHTND